MKPTEGPKRARDLVDAGVRSLKHSLLDIEKRNDLTTEQKVSLVIHLCCASCAAIAIQPIPFGDIFVLTPVQALMAVKIANIHGIRIREQQANEILKETVGLIGMGVAAQQLAIGMYKTVIPFMGAVTTIPLVYSLTYAIGKALDYYFRQKAAKQPINADELKAIFQDARKKGKDESKKHMDR